MQTLPDYRKTLRGALASRSRENPRYNMSRFAQDLGLSPSRISEIFSLRQGLSPASGDRIARALGLSDEERVFFCDQIEAEHGRSREKRELAKIRLQKRAHDQQFKTLELDAFQVVSDWYHFAILQLMELPTFREDSQWIAQALNISPFEASAAIDRLLRLEAIDRDKNGELVKAQDFVATPDGIPSAAIRKFHAQVLEKARVAQEFQPADQRAYSASFVTIRKSDVLKVREKMRRFRRKLLKDMEPAPKDKNSVYCLSMQFFELTQPEKS